jgi:hypothetical protein
MLDGISNGSAILINFALYRILVACPYIAFCCAWLSRQLMYSRSGSCTLVYSDACIISC